jgi:iodotyrosine deiodinase
MFMVAEGRFESVGIATGLLVTALRECGFVALTDTPSPVGFLNKIPGRASHEKPFMLLVVGHRAEDARVPDILRKDLSEIGSFVIEKEEGGIKN